MTLDESIDRIGIFLMGPSANIEIFENSRNRVVIKATEGFHEKKNAGTVIECGLKTALIKWAKEHGK